MAAAVEAFETSASVLQTESPGGGRCRPTRAIVDYEEREHARLAARAHGDAARLGAAADAVADGVFDDGLKDQARHKHVERVGVCRDFDGEAVGVPGVLN